MNREEAIKFIIANSWGDLEVPEVEPLFSMEVWAERPNVAVKLFPTNKPHQFTYGWAKVNWPDKWDYAYGLDMALAKAASKMVRMIGTYNLNSLLAFQTLEEEKKALLEENSSPQRFYPTPFIMR